MSKESNLLNIIARDLYTVFEYELPDTPHRVARAMLAIIDKEGFEIVKKSGEENE